MRGVEVNGLHRRYRDTETELSSQRAGTAVTKESSDQGPPALRKLREPKAFPGLTLQGAFCPGEKKNTVLTFNKV